MKWWLRAYPHEMARVIGNGISPKAFAGKLKDWGFEGLWFSTYNQGRPVWADGWCEYGKDFDPYLKEIGERGMGTVAVVDCFHDKIRFYEDTSTQPVVVNGFMSNGDYRPICPTSPGHLALIAGRVEAAAKTLKPDGIALDYLWHPFYWQKDNGQDNLPMGCICHRCLATARRGDVGLSACEGIEESIDLPKYQCKKLRKKTSWDNTISAWVIWRSAHITQIARELRKLSGRRRKIVHIVPPQEPESLLRDVFMRSAQDVLKLTKEKFTLSPLLHAPLLGKSDAWVEGSLKAFQALNDDTVPGLLPPKGESARTWKRSWSRTLSKLDVEEAIASSLELWLEG